MQNSHQSSAKKLEWTRKSEMAFFAGEYEEKRMGFKALINRRLGCVWENKRKKDELH